MFLLRRPSTAELSEILEGCRDLPLTYAPVGILLQTPAGYDLDEDVVTIGRGESDFSRASEAMADWRHFGFSWVDVFPRNAPLDVGTNVVVVIQHLGFWSANGARIVSRPASTA